MRTITMLAAAAATLTSAYAAFPVGSGEAFLTGDVGYSYDDNVYLSSANSKSTGILTVTPGISIDFGTDALTKNTFSFTEKFVRYTSASSQNNELATVRYNGLYTDAKSSVGLTASYAENAQNNRDAKLNGVIVENNLTTVNPTFSWTVSPKTAVDAALTWETNEYKTATFSDRESWTLPLGLSYEISPKLRATAGYRYTTDDQQGAADGFGHFYNLGAKGDFTPKLSGSFSVGFNERTTKRFGLIAGKTDSGVGLISSFDYAYSDKTKFTASVGNDYQNSGTGATQEVFKLGGSVNTAISEVLSLNASLDYSKNDYLIGGRSDDLWSTKVGVNYNYNKYVKLSGSYAYQDNDSSVASSTFKANNFSVSASIRY